MALSENAITLGEGQPSRRTTGVLVKRRNLTREHTQGEHPADTKAETWATSLQGTGMPKIVSKAPKAWDRLPSAAFRRNQPHVRVNLRLPASRTVRHSISVVGDTQFVVVC